LNNENKKILSVFIPNGEDEEEGEEQNNFHPPPSIERTSHTHTQKLQNSPEHHLKENNKVN